jgi:hypothetical protein
MTGPSMKNSTETARQRIEWCWAPIRMSYILYESSPPSGLEWGPKQLRRVGTNIDVGTRRRVRRSGLRFSARTSPLRWAQRDPPTRIRAPWVTRVVASLDDAVLQSSRDLGALDNKGMAELPPASFFDAIERQATEDGLERADGTWGFCHHVRYNTESGSLLLDNEKRNQDYQRQYDAIGGVKRRGRG